MSKVSKKMKSLLGYVAVCLAVIHAVPTLGFGIGSYNTPMLRSGGLKQFATATKARTARSSCIVMAGAKKTGKTDKLQVLLKANIDGVGKANQVVQVSFTHLSENVMRPGGRWLSWVLQSLMAALFSLDPYIGCLHNLMFQRIPPAISCD